MQGMATIPVMKPKLVSTEHLSPYLKRIDSSRFYSNFGPLACLLEDRLCAHYGLGNGTATMVANGTLGLVLALEKTLQNSITARFTAGLALQTGCLVVPDLTPLLTNIRTLIHEEISFPWRTLFPLSSNDPA